VLVLWFAIFAVRSLISDAFRGLHDLQGATVFGDMTNRCLFLALLVMLWLYFTHASIRTVIALNVVALAVTGFAGLFALHRKALPEGTASHVSLATLLAVAWPVLLTTAANAAYSQVDIWLVGALLDSHSVALYGAAIRLALLIPMPLIVLNTVTAPYIASLHAARRTRELQVLLTRTTTCAALLAAGAVMIYLVGGKFILRLLYGEAYVDAYPLLAILALGQLGVVMMGPSGLTLTMTGQQEKLLVITGASLLAVTVGGFVLIRVVGPLGMALSNAFVSSAATAVAALIASKSAGVWTHARAEVLSPAAALAGAKELLRLMRASKRPNDE
jgi:O-antigen/teichoic acid export membrane protein